MKIIKFDVHDGRCLEHCAVFNNNEYRIYEAVYNPINTIIYSILNVTSLDIKNNLGVTASQHYAFINQDIINFTRLYNKDAFKMFFYNNVIKLIFENVFSNVGDHIDIACKPE